MKRLKAAFIIILALCLLAGCGAKGGEIKESGPAVDANAYTDRVELETVDMEAEAVALSEAPAAVPVLLMPEASGTAVQQNEKAMIDYSNITDGYVMVQFTAETQQRLKVQVGGPTTTYTYDLPKGS